MRALVVAAVLLLGGAVAQARSQRDFATGSGQLWPALVRFLRVDEKVKILEKDQDTGYIVFELVDGKRTFSGSAELVKLDDGKTRVIFKLVDRPAYMEEGMLDRLATKLHDELPPGNPPAEK